MTKRLIYYLKTNNPFNIHFLSILQYSKHQAVDITTYLEVTPTRMERQKSLLKFERGIRHGCIFTAHDLYAIYFITF